MAYLTIWLLLTAADSSAICLCYLALCFFFQKRTIQIRYDSLRICIQLLTLLPLVELLAGAILRFFPNGLTFYTLSEKTRITLVVLGWLVLSGSMLQAIRLAWFDARERCMPDEGQMLVLNEIQTAYREIARRMEIEDPPRLIITGAVSGPCLKGLLCPAVYLSSETFDKSDWPSILTHELFHYKNHDLLFRALLQAATVLFWFNPLIYLWQRQAIRVQEQYCDYCCVERYWVDKRTYQLTLLENARHMGKVSESAASLSPAGKELKSRILQMNRNFRISTGKRVALQMIVLLITLCAGLSSMLLSAIQVDRMNRMQLFQEEGTVNGFSHVSSSRPLKKNAVCDASHISISSGATWNSGQFYLKNTEEYLSLTEYINHPGTLIRIGIVTPDGQKHYITPDSSWNSYQFAIDQTGWYQLHIENRSSGDISINYLVAK